IELKKQNYHAILGSAAIGSLAFAFSDSFWFNAVEAEVYAMATFIMSVLFYLALRWERDMNKPRGNRWVILIAFVIGLSFGVHFMGLLTIPAMGMLYFFKNYKSVTLKNFLIANIVMVAILLFIFKLLLPMTLKFFSASEIFFVNSIGLPFNSGTIIAGFLFTGLFYYLLRFTREKEYVKLNTLLLAILFIFIGFSSWIMLPVRANAGTMINENNPNNARELLAYYNREQYPETHLFYGPLFTEKYVGLDPKKPYKDDKPKFEKDEENGKYIIVNDFVNASQNTDDAQKGLFPRMWSMEHATNYMQFTDGLEFTIKREYLGESRLIDIVKDFNQDIRSGNVGVEDLDDFLKDFGPFLDIQKPTFLQNIAYMFEYQFGYMYWRYFMWNFSGRQNDIQGYGLTGGAGKILEGNWLSGLDFIDDARLGPQETLSDDIKLNKGYNRYYMLPLILGLLGFIFHLLKSPKGWFVVFLLFFLTGIAIVIYLNQKPAEPRERDYAYAASFYAFSIWIGLGIWALFDFARNANINQLKKVAAYAGGGSLAILVIQSLSGNGTTLGISLTYITAVSLMLLTFMYFLGNKFKTSILVPIVPILLGVFVPSTLAYNNWDDHNRSNRSTARDFAANYLNSCDYNAILFTNGDNDTFPLWYIQEVEGVRTDVRVANMSLLSTDWHINQMKKRAYDSDPLPIKMRESVYRSGSRDYVLVSSNDNTKFKANSQRLKVQDKLSKLKASLSQITVTTNSSELLKLVQQSYWLSEVALALKQDDKNYKSKELSKRTLATIQTGFNDQTYINKAKELLSKAGSNNTFSQINQLVSTSDKVISSWPQKWYSAQEAIDFISDDRNKKFFNQSFSCNKESFLNFNNLYLEVNQENAIKHKIIDTNDLKNPKYKSVLKWTLKGSMLYKADLAVLSLLANYQWDRPIYFASVMGMQANRRLQKYMYSEGLTYKLSPVEYGGSGGNNIDKMVQLLRGEYILNKKEGLKDTVGFNWGNMKGEGVLVDYYTMRMVQNLRLQMMKLSDQLIAENRYDEAIEVLDLCFEEMPVENEQVPADDICYYLCSNYFEAGDTLKGNKTGKILADLQLQRLNHFASMDKEHLNYVWNELGKALFNVEMLREASLDGMDRNKMFEPDNSNENGLVSFANKGVLKGTSYDETCALVKEIFINNYREKSAFFGNQQKFPVYYTQLWGGGAN
ncbi:MAG: DUF2723 domain-containing protein, partial [Flavobacteriales bacterium]|nr:DUF2723 domain-containing protein [Flavobacteriales bacterium]